MIKTMLDAFRTLIAVGIILLLFYIVAVVLIGITLKVIFSIVVFFVVSGFIVWCFEGLSKNGFEPFVKLYKDNTKWITKTNTKGNKN